MSDIEKRGSIEQLSREELANLVLQIKEKYHVPEEELNKDRGITIPISIFATDLGPLENLVRYLAEEKHLHLKEIAQRLNRSFSTIYRAYVDAKRKLPLPPALEPGIEIPIAKFSDRTLSILESAVAELRDNFALKNHQVAIMLKRDDRTVWTIYSRVQRKVRHD